MGVDTQPVSTTVVREGGVWGVFTFRPRTASQSTSFYCSTRYIPAKACLGVGLMSSSDVAVHSHETVASNEQGLNTCGERYSKTTMKLAHSLSFAALFPDSKVVQTPPPRCFHTRLATLHT